MERDEDIICFSFFLIECKRVKGVIRDCNFTGMEKSRIKITIRVFLKNFQKFKFKELRITFNLELIIKRENKYTKPFSRFHKRFINFRNLLIE